MCPNESGMEIAINNVFVTVGTTKFDKLINKLQEPSVIETLKRSKCKQLTIQAGSYELEAFDHSSFKASNINVNIYNYADSLHDDMNKADLIIGHAGAGTCLEGLRLDKRMLIVINEDLMDNHQSELASKLSETNYAEHCTVDTLEQSLNNIQSKQIKPFPKQDTTILANFIDSLFKDLIE